MDPTNRVRSKEASSRKLNRQLALDSDDGANRTLTDPAESEARNRGKKKKLSMGESKGGGMGKIKEGSSHPLRKQMTVINVREKSTPKSNKEESPNLSEIKVGIKLMPQLSLESIKNKDTKTPTQDARSRRLVKQFSVPAEYFCPDKNKNKANKDKKPGTVMESAAFPEVSTLVSETPTIDSDSEAPKEVECPKQQMAFNKEGGIRGMIRVKSGRSHRPAFLGRSASLDIPMVGQKETPTRQKRSLTARPHNREKQEKPVKKSSTIETPSPPPMAAKHEGSNSTGNLPCCPPGESQTPSPPQQSVASEPPANAEIVITIPVPPAEEHDEPAQEEEAVSDALDVPKSPEPKTTVPKVSVATKVKTAAAKSVEVKEEKKEICPVNPNSEENIEEPKQPTHVFAYEKECVSLQKRLANNGISVSLQTLQRALLTPSEYRMLKHTRTVWT